MAKIRATVGAFLYKDTSPVGFQIRGRKTSL